MKLTFAPIWPWFWIVLTIAGLVALVLWTYPARVRHLNPGMRRLLIGLRLATVGVIALFLIRPELHIRRDQQDEPRYLYIVADRSRSMRVSDVTSGSRTITRRQALLKALQDANEELDKLGKNVEIRYFNFAETLDDESKEELEDTTDGTETNVELALKQLLRKTDGKRMLGVVFMGDLAPRVAGEDRGKTRENAVAALRGFTDREIRISTVKIGGNGWTGATGDIAVADIQVSRRPYEGKLVTLTATIRANGARGRRLQAKVLIENQSTPGTAGKMVVAREIKTAKPVDSNIVPRTHKDTIKRELTFVPTRPGKYKIAVEVSGLAAERNLANNRLTRIIDVRSGGISVAYIDRMRTELKFLKKVNASDKIQLDYYPVRTGGRVGATKVDPRIFEAGDSAYDVYIIGSVPAHLFGEQNLRALRQRIDDGAGFMMIGGSDSFGPGGWAGTPIADVLPVEMNANAAIFRDEERRTGKRSDLLHHIGMLQMKPTRRGLRRLVMRIAPDGKHAELWNKLDPLEGANRLKKKVNRDAAGQDLIEVLAETPNGSPLMLFQEWGGGNRAGAKAKQRRLARILAFGGDTTYQWYLGGNQAAHQRFWRQVILFLAQKDEEDQPVWVRIDNGGKRHFGPKGTIPIRFGARDAEGKPLDKLFYEIEVIGPRRKDDPTKRHGYTIFHQGGDGENVRTLKENPIPGEYWIRVTGRKSENSLPAGKQSPEYGVGWERFVVESTDLEMDEPAADDSLMETIAKNTAGTYVDDPKDFAAFIKRLRVPQEAQLGMDTVTLWDTWPRLDDEGDRYIPGLLLLFVTLMSVEWFLRKRKGLV